jgi:endonuclease G
MNRLETLQNDPIYAELKDRLKSGRELAVANRVGIPTSQLQRFVDGTFIEGAFSTANLEAVILDFLRPCLIIKDNSYEVAESDTWKASLERYRKLIERRIPSIGRIEFKFHPRYQWGGSGFLIAPNTIVTNRHVAAEIAGNNGKSIVFLQNALGTTMGAAVNFKQEFQRTNGTPMEVGVEKVLYLADEGQPDVAILKLSSNGLSLEPIPVLTENLKSKSEIAVIGYPAYDPVRNPLSPEDVRRIFNDVFEFKRLSPGLVLREDFHPTIFTHDATTLGGNSGSCVLDITTGQVAGLHFQGVFHDANFAVNASSLLDAIAKTSILVTKTAKPVSLPEPVDEEDAIAQTYTELKPEDYSDRQGYMDSFLGDDARVPMPAIMDKENILLFGGGEMVLKYHHFSVIMNEARRLCFLSAVNVNGNESRKTKRPAWRLDPRIKKEQQIIKECYGNPPKFSRGHMTRREDPAWGETVALATLGNADSMHVTNTVPQMQPFNAGIWLGLEEYALQHAKSDQMKISVFTGPFFDKNDPVRDGVKIPVNFWKVIAFIHDETGELCATGYVMSQESFLRPDEFVFGGYKTYQTSIKSIEDRAGLDFGPLAALDPYFGQEVVPAPLESFSQIVLRRR